jgi:hypothetical protein
MTRSIVFIFLSVLFPLFSFAQRKTKLNTNGEGTMFLSAGINRSGYSTTNVDLVGSDYSVVLGNVALSDNAEGDPLLAALNSSSKQWNIQIGYFVTNKWAIIGGYDRYNTFFKTDQEVSLSGTFAPGSHSVYSGTYNGQNISLNQNEFNLEQVQGMNYFNIGLLRMDQWYKSRKANLAFNTILAAKAGPIFSMVNYTLDNSTRQQVSSLSGFGFSGILGLRVDFFQHVYLETNIVGGYLGQGSINLVDNGSETASQIVAFISPQINLGFSFFARPTNGCGTCPNW